MVPPGGHRLPPVPPARLQGPQRDPGLSGGRAAFHRGQRLLAHTADRRRAGGRSGWAASAGARPDPAGGNRAAALETGIGTTGRRIAIYRGG